MKNIFLLAAVAAMSFTSCVKDGGNARTGGEPTRLSIRLAGVVSSSSLWGSEFIDVTKFNLPQTGNEGPEGE
jgi:hypothetical protein